MPWEVGGFSDHRHHCRRRNHDHKRC